jgi:3-hydroxyisobutyrate dehydrogenase-like beta-hydroxyacid dehydrogenase
MTTEKVAFVGLGVMGYPMAGHLSGTSLGVTVYNRTDSRAQQWLQTFSGEKAATPAETAADADIVCLCVGNDDDVRSVVYGETGILAGLKKGAILIDHTTASPQLAKELDLAVTEAGSEFLDAPVSGGQAGAENKAVNQICIAGVLQGLSEGLHFAEKVGLDINAVVDVISKGAAQSWQMENRAATMADAEFDFGFAVDWMRKDLAIALATANAAGVSLPLTALVDQFYQDVQRQGGGRWDSSSLIQRLRSPDAR